MIIRAIDTETTGIPSPTEPHALCEIGWADLDQERDGGAISKPESYLVNPGREIPIEAMAVHHIRDADVADAIKPDAAVALLAEGATMWCAHRADFESQFFGGKPLLCTWKAALRVWPDAPSHGLSALRYLHKYDDMSDFDRAAAMPPHRAGPDAYVCAFLMRHILGLCALEDVTRWSAGPALLARFDFGKYYGKPWAEVAQNDPGYLEWVLGNIKDDRDKRATAKYYLKKVGRL